MHASTRPLLPSMGANPDNSSSGGGLDKAAGSSVSLPPLRRSGEALDAALGSSSGGFVGGSPLRQARKAELVAFAVGKSPDAAASPAGLLLDLELKEQKLAAMHQHKDVGRQLLETWLDDVLTSFQPASGKQQQQQQQPNLKGAAAAGLARQQLLAAGLSNADADQLYRSLYVYSVGFLDIVKGLLASNDHRQELLYSIWKTFLVLAEHAMKATFKSDYVALVSAAGTAMTELLCSKQALSEARSDNAVLVKDLGWLSAAEAESAALRRGLQSQVEGLQAALALEQQAHQHAVLQYVDALEARSAMALQLQEAQQQLHSLQAAHSSLQQQHQDLQSHYNMLSSQCRAVRDVFKRVDVALALDLQLVEQLQQGQQQQPSRTGTAVASVDAEVVEIAANSINTGTASPAPASDSCSNQQQMPDTAQATDAAAAETVAALGEDMQPLAERLAGQVEAMYFQWRSAVDARCVALTDTYRMSDQLREEREAHFQAQQAAGQLQKSLDRMGQQLVASQADSADLNARLLAAHEAAARHMLELGDAEAQLHLTRHKADKAEKRCADLDESVSALREELAGRGAALAKLELQLAAAAERLARKHRLMAEVSKGFAVAMQSLWALQTGRAVLVADLELQRQKGAHMGSSLEGKDARLHDLDAQVQEQSGRLQSLQSDLALVEASLQDSQRQVMSLGGRLALTEAKNDELLGQAQALTDQLGSATTKLNKTTTKLEVAQGQLNKAARDIKELREAAHVSERLLGEARLSGRSLAAEVERLTREKRDLQERAEATKARLDLEVQRLTGEMSAADRKLELVAADLAAERDRVTGSAALLERKRGKKRRWKAAYSTSCSEVLGLHQQLLAKQKELEGLEGRLRRLETELKLLGVNSSVRLTGPAAAAAAGASAGAGGRVKTAQPGSAFAATELQRPGSADAGNTAGSGQVVALLVDLPAARKAHQTAADEAASLGGACLKLDAEIEELEVAQQQLLLKLAAPDLTTEQMQAIKQAAAGKLSELAALRGRRSTLEASRGAAAAAVRAAEAALRGAQQERLQQRQRVLEQQALQVSDLANAAAMAQVAAAESAGAAVQERLGQQLAAFEQSQADKVALTHRMTALQAGIEKFTQRITALQAEGAAAAEQLQRANTVINFLQVEVTALKSERERIKSSASDTQGRVAALEAELESAKQAVSVALRGLEAQHAAERALQDQKQATERARAAAASRAAEAVAAGLRVRCSQLVAGLEMMAWEARALRQGSRHDLTACCTCTGVSGSSSSSGRAGSVHTAGVETAPAAASGLLGQGLLASLSGSGSSSGSNSRASGSLSGADAGAGGGDGPAGPRWLYQYQEAGPWATARQVLLAELPGPAAAAAAAAASSTAGGGSGSSVAGGGAGRQQGTAAAGPGSGTLWPAVLCVPPVLPGLSFSSDSLAVLIGELMLDKITSDAAADVSCLTASGAAAPAGTAEPAGSSGLAVGGAVMGDGGGLDVGGKGAALVAAWWAGRQRRDLEGSVFTSFMSRLGGRLVTECHCSALVTGIRKAAPRNKRARLFGCCLGLLEPVVPPAGVGTLLHFLAQLHSTCGPLTGEATEGSSQVMCRTAISLAGQTLHPSFAPACPEVVQLSAAMTAAAGGSTDNTIEVDDCLELLLAAWLAQRAADWAQLELLFGLVDTKGRGLAQHDPDFALLLKQVCPGVACRLTQLQLSSLFLAALAASGPGAAVVSAAGAAAALLDSGLVGSGAHVRPQPAIAHRPPFSEYRLMEDSWHAVKPLLQDLQRTLPKKVPAMAVEVSATQVLVKKLDDLLEGCAPAADCWQLYRRILGFYSHHGTFTHLPPAGTNTPLAGSSAGSKNMHSTSLAGRSSGVVPTSPSSSAGGPDSLFDGALPQSLAGSRTDLVALAGDKAETPGNEDGGGGAGACNESASRPGSSSTFAGGAAGSAAGAAVGAGASVGRRMPPVPVAALISRLGSPLQRASPRTGSGTPRPVSASSPLSSHAGSLAGSPRTVRP